MSKDLPMREKMASTRPKKRHQSKHKTMAKDEHKQSRMERSICEYLDSINERYIDEKTFPGLESLISGVNIHLDFYLPDRKMAIEYDGEQHFSLLPGEKASHLERRRLNDLTKDLFCKQRGIYLLRIKYTAKKYFKEMIQRAFKEIENGKNK